MLEEFALVGGGRETPDKSIKTFHDDELRRKRMVEGLTGLTGLGGGLASQEMVHGERCRLFRL